MKDFLHEIFPFFLLAVVCFLIVILGVFLLLKMSTDPPTTAEVVESCLRDPYIYPEGFCEHIMEPR